MEGDDLRLKDGVKDEEKVSFLRWKVGFGRGEKGCCGWWRLWRDWYEIVEEVADKAMEMEIEDKEREMEEGFWRKWEGDRLNERKYLEEVKYGKDWRNRG